jgi:regulator of cell morphogenesis and NO signaling
MTDAAPLHAASDLTGSIDTRTHQRHRAKLPPLLKMAEMVEDLHETDAGVPKGLHHVLACLGREMDSRMTAEKAILSPVLRRGGASRGQNPAAVIRSAHARQGALVAEIRRLTGGLTPPSGACTCWATLYADLATFIDDLTPHMQLAHEGCAPRYAR